MEAVSEQTICDLTTPNSLASIVYGSYLLYQSQFLNFIPVVYCTTIRNRVDRKDRGKSKPEISFVRLLPNRVGGTFNAFVLAKPLSIRGVPKGEMVWCLAGFGHSDTAEELYVIADRDQRGFDRSTRCVQMRCGRNRPRIVNGRDGRSLSWSVLILGRVGRSRD